MGFLFNTKMSLKEQCHWSCWTWEVCEAHLEAFPHYSGFGQYKSTDRVCSGHLVRPWLFHLLIFSQECSSTVMCAVLRYHKCQLFMWLYFSSPLSLAGWGLPPVFGLRPQKHQLLWVQKLDFQSPCTGIHAAVAGGLCQVRTGGDGWRSNTPWRFRLIQGLMLC